MKYIHIKGFMAIFLLMLTLCLASCQTNQEEVPEGTPEPTATLEPTQIPEDYIKEVEALSTAIPDSFPKDILPPMPGATNFFVDEQPEMTLLDYVVSASFREACNFYTEWMQAFVNVTQTSNDADGEWAIYGEKEGNGYTVVVCEFEPKTTVITLVVHYSRDIEPASADGGSMSEEAPNASPLPEATPAPQGESGDSDPTATP